MKKIWLVGIAWIGLLGLAHADDVPASRPESTAARTQIQHLVDAFREAIIARDGAGLDRLFLPDSAWLSVYDDATYRSLKAKRSNASKLMPDSYKKFTGFVSGSPKPLEEKFSDVRIETDGTVATVYFNYAFFYDGKQTNDGNETWQLVNTGDGWKIDAMLYSVRLDPAVLRRPKR